MQTVREPESATDVAWVVARNSGLAKPAARHRGPFRESGHPWTVTARSAPSVGKVSTIPASCRPTIPLHKMAELPHLPRDTLGHCPRGSAEGLGGPESIRSGGNRGGFRRGGWSRHSDLNRGPAVYEIRGRKISTLSTPDDPCRVGITCARNYLKTCCGNAALTPSPGTSLSTSMLARVPSGSSSKLRLQGRDQGDRGVTDRAQSGC